MLIAQSAALSIAFILDLIFPDPNFALHPIRLMGGVISALEKVFRAVFPKTKTGEIFAGVFMVIFTVAICGGVPFAILFFAYRTDMIIGAAIETVICYFMLAARSLGNSSMEVYTALMSGDTEGARRSVSMIVGRDTASLDEAGITKAAVETVAENTSDGVIAPLLYMTLGGCVLGCVYKAINTMDSMVGYKNEKYISFGKCAAKLDDIVNYIPSRISAYLMILSSFFLGLDFKNAARIYKRDRHNHASPNSAQTESAAAGALDIQLAGDAYYFGELYKKPFIGDAVKDINFHCIKNMNKLMYMTAAIAFVIFIGIKFLIGSVI